MASNVRRGNGFREFRYLLLFDDKEEAFDWDY